MATITCSPYNATTNIYLTQGLYGDIKHITGRGWGVTHSGLTMHVLQGIGGQCKNRNRV